ncbi:MAG: serine O-acetyltransferase [Alphaproteobacteria bacterium]
MGETVFRHIGETINAYLARDPAARSRVTILLAYPGLHAVIWHRLANWCWRRGWHLVGRLLSQFGRWVTGIEIHPAARIGRGLVIDHGMGVVIGETAEIGDDVTLYHDVTLGGISPSVDSHNQRDTKRHPTVLDRAIIGSGAQVLGPITVGRDARVGANAVVVKDVPDGATVVGIPARVVKARAARPDRFDAYGTPTEDLPDPMARAIEGLLDRVSELQMRVAELEREAEAGGRLAYRKPPADEEPADEEKERAR